MLPDSIGSSRLRVAGKILLLSVRRENIASTLPAAPSKWPIDDLVEHCTVHGMDPNYEITRNGNGIGEELIDFMVF